MDIEKKKFNDRLAVLTQKAKASGYDSEQVRMLTKSQVEKFLGITADDDAWFTNPNYCKNLRRCFIEALQGAEDAGLEDALKSELAKFKVSRPNAKFKLSMKDRRYPVLTISINGERPMEVNNGLD